MHIINHTGTLNGIGAGQTATFDVEFVGDGRPHRFDLQFVREGTNVVLGSIPVVLGTPIPGDNYEYEDLDDGQIEDHGDFGSAAIVPSTVVNRQLFYNHSFFDDPFNDPSFNDDTAIATDKAALLPGGGLGSFVNYTTYDKGINGVMIDLAAASSHAAIVASDFSFKTSGLDSEGSLTTRALGLRWPPRPVW